MFLPDKRILLFPRILSLTVHGALLADCLCPSFGGVSLVAGARIVSCCSGESLLRHAGSGEREATPRAPATERGKDPRLGGLGNQGAPVLSGADARHGD